MLPVAGSRFTPILPLFCYREAVEKSARLRRGKGSGNQRADGTWRIRVTAAGRARDFYGATQREARARAEEWAANAGQEAERNDHLATTTTLTAWLAEWLTENRRRLRPQTWARYEVLARHQLVPVLGDILLADLRPPHIRRLHTGLHEAGLSTTTQRHAHVMLGTALQAAVERGLMPSNPVRAVRAPRLAAHEKTILSREEAARLIEASQGDRYHALYVLALTTGMRGGELLALRWRDVDLDHARLTVNGTVVHTLDGRLDVQQPKTMSGRRTIQLSRVAVTALRAMLGSSDLVFPSPGGGLLSTQELLAHHFRALVRRAGCPRATTMHSLRHTCATHLLEDGVPAHVVSRMLGHASVAITLSIYAHVTPRMLDAAVAAMDTRYGRLTA